MKGIRDKILGSLPDLKWPELTKEVKIAVYLIHNSTDPEDYFFLFDFEEFVDRSKSGLFARPVIQIFAGRDDFSRTQFARAFREVFATEFDRMRVEVSKGNGKRGWLDWGSGLGIDTGSISAFVSSILLAIALSAGRSVLPRIPTPSFLKGRSAEAKLADEIDKTKVKVEKALRDIQVTLHPELYDFAYRDGHRGPNASLDRDAWPLPQFVRAHLNQGKSGSWW